MTQKRTREWTLETVRSRCIEVGKCWLWDQSCNSGGYPQASINGRNTMVRRFVFETLLDKRVRDNEVVSSRCRRMTCCSPDCLVALTYSERLKRCYSRGTRSTTVEYLSRRRRAVKQGITKLSIEKARDIRSRVGQTHSELAREFGVHRSTIKMIRLGKYWRDHAENSSVFGAISVMRPAEVTEAA
jgi:DNA-binding XRE family transcriptional regulator